MIAIIVLSVSAFVLTDVAVTADNAVARITKDEDCQYQAAAEPVPVHGVVPHLSPHSGCLLKKLHFLPNNGIL
jgi:hypothetical protein